MEIFSRQTIARVALTGIAVVAATVWADRHIHGLATAACFTSIDDVPSRRVGLVLGTAKRLRWGVENPYYRYRIEAAARLYHSGKIEYVLVSGDNRSRYYNEPMDMTADLVAEGVPYERIYRDYAGLRTLDSIARAKKVFGLDGFIVVSQPFHNERALYLARAYGLDAVGYNARDLSGSHGYKTQLREKFARLAAVVDLKILHRRPRFLGPRIEIGIDPAV